MKLEWLRVPDNPRQGIYRIFAPQWKEVILLWLGREDVRSKEKEKFIQALVEFNDGCGECRAIDRVRRGFYEFRAYFLAAAAVDEWKNSCNADAIVAEIVKWRFGKFNIDKWVFHEFKIEQQKWERFPEPIEQGANTALLQTERTKAIHALVQLICNCQDKFACMQAASSLGQIGLGSQTAIDALVQLICNSQNEFIRRYAASSLGQIGLGNQKEIDALVQLIYNSQSKTTRGQAVSSLGQIGLGNQAAIDALVELINNSEYEFLRMRAASSLGQINPRNRTAIDALEQLINNSLDKLITRQAASILKQLELDNQKEIDALAQSITNYQYEHNCMQATPTLKQIELDNQREIDALVQTCNSEDEFTCMEVISSLGQIGLGNQTAIDVLVELIYNSPSEMIHSQAAETLWTILAEEKQMAGVVTALKDYLSDETYENDFWRLHKFHNCYNLIWKCAENMTYPTFYQAWHQQEKVKDGE
ncbi:MULTISPECIES: HEAT repeat domain-containing protein [unclassified Nostoc]|uniref:HEAT repeat domain-containing protein n=1 Tax=unclassified Nostoc TaxID=2593658 RepID=UPI0026318279|nr:HEAT repeat domain-containing protein [Nostoc sp. S13]MDF5738189.1 HEAT repeat domain-containing protein [Nostoc sp. S13]